ncbi:MAG: GH1 family beta-glucosidase [Roseiflexaceae bacterium]
MTAVQFPKGFLWGAATASFQIEGSTKADGRGESIWDRFAATPGKVLNGDTGDPACDHYQRWREDVALMRDLGVKAYRFSVAWPRILPGGSGSVNEAGLDFYDRLVDELLRAGITPYPTLYHWDLPQVLQDKGGWANRDTAMAFVEYADAVTRVLGDRVKNWITHNEPWCVAFLGYWLGEHAPGIKQGPVLEAAHHVLLSHGMAVPIIRANSAGAQVGITLNFSPADPASESEADRQAAWTHDGFFNRWFLDPVFRGSYPQDMLDRYSSFAAPPVQPGDLQQIAAPIDFLGVNYYNRAVICADPQGPFGYGWVRPEGEYTDMDWEVYPDALRRLLVRIQNDYQPKRMFITENGAAYPDTLSPTGAVQDPGRVNYLRGHLAACEQAIAEGAKLEGYFVWSLMDNFEWAWGYTKRFGIVYVDYASQRRILKDSARFYRSVIQQNGFGES